MRFLRQIFSLSPTDKRRARGLQLLNQSGFPFSKQTDENRLDGFALMTLGQWPSLNIWASPA